MNLTEKKNDPSDNGPRKTQDVVSILDRRQNFKRRKFLGPVWPSCGLDFDEERRYRRLQSAKTSCIKSDELTELRLQLIELREDLVKHRRNGKRTVRQIDQADLGAIPLKMTVLS